MKIPNTKQRLLIVFVLAFLITLVFLFVLRPKTVNVRDYGAQGDGIADDTDAIQNAIKEFPDRIIYIPDGTYQINTDESIWVLDNTRLELQNEAVLKAIANSSENNAVITVKNVSDVVISGGKIVGDRNRHTGTTGEWGIGIKVVGSDHIRISDVSISECWGDGIYIGSTDRNRCCEDVIVQNFILESNRRNGISVTSAVDLTISNGTISNTGGTEPNAGICIEPNSIDEILQNVLIKNIQTINNQGFGLDICFCKAGSRNRTSIKIDNYKDFNSKEGSINKGCPYFPADSIRFL